MLTTDFAINSDLPAEIKSRQLTLADALAVQGCYDSQPLIMLTTKIPDAPPYAQTYSHLLSTGCLAFGSFINEQMTAFVVVWPWPDLPASTLVLFCSRPDGKIFNPERTGLRAAMDATLRSLETRGYRTLYFVRSSGGRWKHSTILKRFGRFAEYSASPIEQLQAGQRSRFAGVNQRVLGGSSVRAQAAVIVAVAPAAEDF
jgi:hypothetical protein